MYGILQEAAEERNLSVNDEVFVNEVYWALTKLKLRLYEESNRADQKK